MDGEMARDIIYLFIGDKTIIFLKIYIYFDYVELY